MKIKYPAKANPGGRKAPPTMSPATAVASWEVMDPGFETRSTRRTVLYPTIAIAMMPSAGTKADAMSVHRRVSGGCKARDRRRRTRGRCREDRGGPNDQCERAENDVQDQIHVERADPADRLRFEDHGRPIRHRCADGGRDAHERRAVPDSIKVSFAPR